jgi:hypothetical protein
MRYLTLRMERDISILHGHSIILIFGECLLQGVDNLLGALGIAGIRRL